MFLLCSHAQAGPDNNLNIYGVFNELYAPAFPARQDRLVLAGIIEWDNHAQGRMAFKIDLRDPSDRSIFTIEGHTNVDPVENSDSPPKSQFVLPMEKVLFPVAGRYKVRLIIEGKELTGPSIYLIKRPKN